MKTKAFLEHVNTTKVVISQKQTELEAKDVLPNINRMQAAKKGRKMPFLSLVTLTFDLQTHPTRDQTCLPCQFCTNPLSGSGDISYTNKKPRTDGNKNRTFRSSLRAVTTVTTDQDRL